MNRILQYACHDAADLVRFEPLLERITGTNGPVVDAVERRCLDTFDRRLERRGLLLEVDAGEEDAELSLRRLDGRAEEVRCRNPSTPQRAGDIVDGRMRRLVETITSPRVLLPWLEYPVCRHRYTCRDANGKTVATLVVEHCPARGSPRCSTWFASIEAKKGYAKEAKAFAREIAAHLPPASRLERDRALFVADALGVSRREYASSPKIPMSRDTPAAQALARALLAYLDVMIANEDGVRAGTDPEFLHDFRVAMRRSRSLSGAFPEHFEARRRARFRKDFAWLSAGTGALRDLDVLTLEIERCVRAGSDHRAGDAALVEHVARLRRAAHRRVRRMLESKRYVSFKTDWSALLADLPHAVRGKDKPIIEVASRAIRRRHRTIVRRIRSGKAMRSEQSIHELRKDCKKLRYLLEAFASLYPRKRLRKAVRKLKRLQDFLGRICDGYVRRDMLAAWRDAAARREIDPVLPERLEHVLALAGAPPPPDAIRAPLMRFVRPRTLALYKGLFGRGAK